jgi:penicillin-binding protein 1C
MTSGTGSPRVTSPLVGEVDLRRAGGASRHEDIHSSAIAANQPSSLTLRRKGGANRPRLRRPWCVAGAAGLGLTVLLIGGGAAWIHSLGPVPLGEGLEFSTLVLDREDRLLRPYPTSDGRWRMPVTTANVDPRTVDALIAYEDKRFRSHWGIDPLALGRAALQFIRSGRIVSGGSTLTMQVARLLEPRAERTPGAKLRQMVRAIQLERVLTKDEILGLHLSLAPYGGNLEGIRAATYAYFGKEPRRLSLGETALLVALPQSPEVRRPDRSVGSATAARARVLERIAAAGIVPGDEVAAAKTEPVPSGRRPMPALAPHAADAAIATYPERRLHRLTIEAPLQKSLQDLARERARSLGADISVAILVVDHGSGDVLTRVASADYFDERRAGQVDMTQALRSPGSALKPFIYGLGFEDGLIHPETLIEDRPIRYGSYAPENFDLTFQGTVTVRKALQLSLNVPAVAVLESVRASRLTARLGQAGVPLALPPGEVPGLAMGLGGVGVRLADLTTLYAGLARLGSTVPLAERRDAEPRPAQSRRLLDPLAAWYVGDVLLGTPPPENAARGRIAFKTGTSYGYRDAWSLGFDGKRTVGVWVGRPDGAPVPGLTGRAAAAPILFDAFARMGRSPSPLPSPPRGALIATVTKLPPPLQHFQHGSLLRTRAEAPLRIVYPPNGARLDVAQAAGRTEPVALKIAGGVAPWTVLVNGVPQESVGRRQTLFWVPDGPGFVRLTVTDANGAAESVVVRIQ